MGEGEEGGIGNKGEGERERKGEEKKGGGIKTR
jgi:hypothetical protein